VLDATNVGVGPSNYYQGSSLHPSGACNPGLGPGCAMLDVCCVACPSYGGAGGIVVGTAGDAFVAVPWGSCGLPSYGSAGVQIFEVDAAGAVTGGAAPGGGMAVSTLEGSPAPIGTFGISGASHWAMIVDGSVFETSAFTSEVATSTSSSLVPAANANPGVLPPAVDGDAAGSTFFTFEPGLGLDYLQKLDATGAVAWTVPPLGTLGSGSTLLSLAAVAADGTGGAYVGYEVIQGSHDFGCGAVAVPGQGVMRVDTSGMCVWNDSIVGTPLTTAAGQLYVYGPASSTTTFVDALDPSTGAVLWSKTFATTALGVQLFPGGDVLLSTTFHGTIDLGGGTLTSAGTSDLALTVLSSSGAPVWSKSFGGAGATVTPTELSPDTTGGVALMVGVTGGSVSFGAGAVSGDVLVKLGATGAFRWEEAPFGGQFIASDPCGAVLTATSCKACAPGVDWGVSVSKLAP
jgi:outer membrane protein assembly factor BamB